MSAVPKKSKRFPWRKGSIILLLLIGAVVVFDCKIHGSYEASKTNLFIRNSEIDKYSQKVWIITKVYSNKGLAYLESLSPNHYKIASGLVGDYSKLAGDFYIVGRNLFIRNYNNFVVYVDEKRPAVVETIEYYFPGWIEILQTVGAKQLENTKKYSAQVAVFCSEQSTKLVRWLETSVFVGEMSPENIRAYTTKALKSTQTLANQAYDWVYEKVQTLSKME